MAQILRTAVASQCCDDSTVIDSEGRLHVRCSCFCLNTKLGLMIKHKNGLRIKLN